MIEYIEQNPPTVLMLQDTADYFRAHIGKSLLFDVAISVALFALEQQVERRKAELERLDS